MIISIAPHQKKINYQSLIYDGSSASTSNYAIVFDGGNANTNSVDITINFGGAQ